MIAIMAILSTVVVFSVQGQGEKAKRRATAASMRVINTGIKQYYLDYSSYPLDLAALQRGGFIEKDQRLRDGWEREFLYSPSGSDPEHPYALQSSGADGQSGTDDDISVWNMDSVK